MAQVPMQDNRIPEDVAILVCADTGAFDAEASLDELAELADTAGVRVVGRAIQRRSSLDAATCIGTGRLLEITEQAKALEANLLIFDQELSGTQERNISEQTELRVIDRTTLILDIFAGRAVSREGRLQVALAQYRYRLPRLTGQGKSLSRLGGGVGTRGPGETKLESDRRHIRRLIRSLETELLELTARRGLTRARRKKEGVSCIAIVGYTNAGKSTLLNALTSAGVLAEDKLFATLDPTARALTLPDGRHTLLIDTVGLIRRLPHHLIEAFKSTLEEAANADLIVQVTDISSPDAAEHARVTKEILTELGCAGIPLVEALNKCDLARMPLPIDSRTVPISAKTGEGLERLLEVMADALPAAAMRLRLLIPYDRAGLIARLREEGKVFSEEYQSEGVSVDALVGVRSYPLVEAYRVREQ